MAPDTDIIAGLAVIAIFLSLCTCLVLQSRRTIRRIARKHVKSARLLLQELKHE